MSLKSFIYSKFNQENYIKLSEKLFLKSMIKQYIFIAYEFILQIHEFT